MEQQVSSGAADLAAAMVLLPLTLFSSLIRKLHLGLALAEAANKWVWL